MTWCYVDTIFPFIFLFSSNSAISEVHHAWQEHVTFRWDDAVIMSARPTRLVGFYSTTPLIMKQQAAGRPVAPLGHSILIQRQPVFALITSYCMVPGDATCTYQLYNLWFDENECEFTIYRTRGEHANHYTHFFLFKFRIYPVIVWLLSTNKRCFDLMTPFLVPHSHVLHVDLW